MRKHRLSKIILTLLFTVSTTCLFAQSTFKYKADLSKIDSDHFYRINLQPGLIARSKADLSDIRISDKNGKPVPYIFGDQLPSGDKNDFVELRPVLPIINNDTATIFRIQNTGHLTISQLYLKLRNTAVERNVDIAGSDDLKQWYAIKENISLDAAADSNNGVYEQMFNFPASNYSYFKITINHKNHEPVAVLKAGIYKQLLTETLFSEISNVQITQKDSDKISYVTIRFDAPYQVDQLQFNITGSKYYKRKALLYHLNNNERYFIGETEISSAGLPVVKLSAKASKILIEIYNDDNPPLTVKTIKAFQLDRSLICYLEKGGQYQITFGDSTVLAPQYDLKAFTDSLHQRLPVIEHGVIIGNVARQIITPKPSGIPNWAIWAAITLVVALLALLTFKMTGEVKKREAQ